MGGRQTLFPSECTSSLMVGEMVTFALLSLSSIIIIVNPLGATLTFVSLTSLLDRETRLKVAV